MIIHDWHIIFCIRLESSCQNLVILLDPFIPGVQYCQHTKFCIMNTILWIGQAVLAFIFLVSGFFKSTKSERWLVAHKQTGVEGLRPHVIKFIGICELLGAAGLILPWWLNIWPALTPVTAFCFAVVMGLAAPIHAKRNEPQNVVTNIVIMIVCLLVAFGRSLSFR